MGGTGVTGSSGASGITGASGASGDVGLTGATGATGLSGNAGATGGTGGTGVTGSVGGTGATGPSGGTGATGAGYTGSSGATGFTGASGPDGASGGAGVTGPSGEQGSSGVPGSTGSTGASGASGVGDIPASSAVWNPLVLGATISVSSGDVAPACFNDGIGGVYWRGQMTVRSGSSAKVGPIVLGALPLVSDFCLCSPNSILPSPNRSLAVGLDPVFVTGNALTPSGNLCAVQLKISFDTAADVNGDYVVDASDVLAVQNDVAYCNDSNLPSYCGVGAFAGSGGRCGTRSSIPAPALCGRADVNGDGAVNDLDIQAITDAFGLRRTEVQCGTVQATVVACGASRTGVPIVQGLALDGINYFDENSTPMAIAKRMLQELRIEK